MNDRELLELAAKAAGFEVVPYTWFKGTSLEYDGFHTPSSPEEWNPLADRGDAMLIIGKLCIDFKMYAADGHLMASCYRIGALGHPCGGDLEEYYEPILEGDIGNSDIYQRAAVGLAAQIGKAMP